MNQTEIRATRVKFGFSLSDVCGLLGRDKSWLSRIESGKLLASAATVRNIFRAIKRLDQATRISAVGFDDLRLEPRVRRRTKALHSVF